MSLKKLVRLNPVCWGLLIFTIAQILVLLIIYRIDPFLEKESIYIPSQPSQTISWWPGEVTLPSGEVTEIPAESSLGPILVYFLATVAVVGLTLSLIPLRALSLILRLLFAFLFIWGAFIATVFYLPLALAITIAVVFGILWFIMPIIWFHDLALILALASLGAVFARFITPWTVMVLILVLAIYDFLAVRFKFMPWIANRLSRINALPAIIVPRHYSEWSLNLKKNKGKVIENNPVDRKYSILGGGDIAFPCLLTASVYFSQGLIPGIFIALFGLLGLVSAYVIQARFLKGKPIPALPPIAGVTLVGLILVL